MLATISLKSRPGSLAVLLSTNSRTIFSLLFGIFSQLKHLCLNGKHLSIWFVRRFASIEKNFWFVNLCCPYFLIVSFGQSKKNTLNLSLKAKEKKTVCKFHFAKALLYELPHCRPHFGFGFQNAFKLRKNTISAKRRITSSISLNV